MTRSVETRLSFDFIVVGSGLAGLYAAAAAADHGRVALLTKSEVQLSSSWWAQGGIAAAIDPEDSAYLHFDDTIAAGRGLCRRATVEILVSEGIERVRELIRWGMKFDEDHMGLALGLEGGHSKRRILHAEGNATGQAVTRFLLNRVKAHPNIRLFENTTVAELVVVDNRCVGCMAFYQDRFEPWFFTAPATILATGGAAGNYERTTNPPTSSGDGIALAYRAGAEVCDMEFVQFHPTAFYDPGGETFLLSEALRGEGAHLLNRAGERFMERYDPRAELAPRDVVAAAIFREMHREGSPCVWLSMRHLDARAVRERFSNVYEACRARGLDLTADLIPVAPAAHYTIGGIVTGRMAGSSIWGLFACGECACTGVHGANRLASNSLLECLVFARRAVEGARTVEPARESDPLLGADLPVRDPTPVDPALMNRLRAEVSHMMTEHVGIIRNGPALKRTLDALYDLRDRYGPILSKWAGRPLRTMMRACTLTVRGALLREESRGAHQREDFPEENPAFEGHITLKRGTRPRLVKWT
ncbi:MAG: L-aspartate oxidase [Kiritimatiellae bacterium]|nr:L-aspartate oxidase [Kiritimatiellia bacterium]MDW8458232.1 L-aspartate oxidase [Verrucomicrobiota bacterium]